MAAAGYPLEGDPLYGPGGNPVHQLDETGHRVLGLPRDCGYLLHSACISFDHPSEDIGTRVTVRSDQQQSGCPTELLCSEER